MQRVIIQGEKQPTEKWEKKNFKSNSSMRWKVYATVLKDRVTGHTERELEEVLCYSYRKHKGCIEKTLIVRNLCAVVMEERGI